MCHFVFEKFHGKGTTLNLKTNTYLLTVCFVIMILGYHNNFYVLKFV